MALPRTIAYDLPEIDVPGRVTWVPESHRSALLVHDMQHYFVRPYGEDCSAFRAAVDGTARLLELARAQGVPVFFTAQPGDQEPVSRGLLTDLWGPGLSAREEDVAIIDELAPLPDEPVLVKHRYSAFARSDFEQRLRAVGRDQLVITGVYAHIGIAATATDALMRDIQPFVVRDAVCDFSQDDHVRALVQVGSIGGVVTSVADVAAALDPVPAEPRVVPDSPWAAWLATRLGDLLGGQEAAAALVATPDADMFQAGMSSLLCFTLLDDLADLGVDIEFTELVRNPRTSWVLACIDASGAVAPATAS